MEGFFGGIILFLMITVVAAVLFAGWVAFALARAIIGGIVGIVRMLVPDRQALSDVDGVVCGYARCRAGNPTAARYCRRCGRPLHEMRNIVGRAAVL
jgi:hypothetical protein